jgi:hypothetical protein
MSTTTITYAQQTNLYGYEFPIPEIDVACYDNINIDASLSIIKDLSYNHRVILADIDISANVFKKLFFDTEVTLDEFNTFTGSYLDYMFKLLTPPATPALDNVGYSINGKQYYYYQLTDPSYNLASYINISTPSRTIYDHPEKYFCLHDELIDNIIDDIKSINSEYATMINTCSLIDFNNDVLRLKTLNDVIKNNLDHCSLYWNNIIEMVRCEYADTTAAEGDEDALDASGNRIDSGNTLSTPKYAILMITLVFKTTVNLNMADCQEFVSSTEVKLRYKVNFSEIGV